MERLDSIGSQGRKKIPVDKEVAKLLKTRCIALDISVPYLINCFGGNPSSSTLYGYLSGKVNIPDWVVKKIERVIDEKRAQKIAELDW